jgi:DNA-directed RNA polymerase beta' subunit
LEKIEKIDMCPKCSHPQPDIKYNSTDNNISMVYKQKDKGKISIVIPVDDIKKTFENLTDDNVRLLGFDPNLVHPKSLIMTLFPVIPYCCRPFVLADGQTCDDDLTIQLVEIIKANNHLKMEDGVPLSDTKRQKYIQTLKFRISTFYNNSASRAKHTTSGRPIKGLKERITGKEGLIRSNIMGKRCEFTGRTVIGPDPTLKMGQLGIPKIVAKTLTIPVQVTNFNYEYLNNLVNEGKVNIVKKKDGERINIHHHIFNKGTRLNHGDIIIRKDEKTGEEYEFENNNGKEVLKHGDKLKRNGELVKNIRYPEKRLYHLNIGDICERQLQNGDIVLLNRQPTLHVGSMMAQEIVIHDGKTFRFNLSINKSYNADENRR